MDKLTKMANTVQHLDAIRGKLFKPEIVLSPVEQYLLFEVIGSKIQSIINEAEPYLPKRKRGRPATGKSEDVANKELEIACMFHRLFDPTDKNSESVYCELSKKYMCGEYTNSKRSMIMRAKKNGEEYHAKCSEERDKKRKEEKIRPQSEIEAERISRRNSWKVFGQGQDEYEETLKY